MDMSLVTAAVGMMASNTQSQVATRVLKMNLDAQKQVLQLLAPAQTPAANNAFGIGGHVDGQERTLQYPVVVDDRDAPVAALDAGLRKDPEARDRTVADRRQDDGHRHQGDEGGAAVGWGRGGPAGRPCGKRRRLRAVQRRG